MGFAYSKVVEIEMPKIPRKCRSRENRGPAAVKRTSSANSIRSSSTHHKHKKRTFGPTLRHLHEQTHYYNYYNLATRKPQTYTDKTKPSNGPDSNKKSKVLIVNPDDEDDDDFAIYRQKRPKSEELRLLDSFEEDFEDIERQLKNYPQDDENTEFSRAKLRRFVVAWRAALAFPHTRILIIPKAIPIAATSYSRKGIGFWKRSRRFCARCSTRATEELMEDLLHRDSLDRFIEETEKCKTATVDQVIIKNDLTKKKLEDVAHHHSESVETVPPKKSVSKTTKASDMKVDIRIDIPAPVHVEHPIDDMKFSDLALKKKKRIKFTDRVKQKLHLTKKTTPRPEDNENT